MLFFHIAPKQAGVDDWCIVAVQDYDQIAARQVESILKAHHLGGEWGGHMFGRNGFVARESAKKVAAILAVEAPPTDMIFIFPGTGSFPRFKSVGRKVNL